METNIQRELARLIALCENRVGDRASMEFERIAMQSPENFKIALDVKTAYNKPYRDSGSTRQKYVLGYTLPWIADPDIVFICKVRKPGHSAYVTEFGLRWLNVFDVHGVEMACECVDANMHPIPHGIAYEYVPGFENVRLSARDRHYADPDIVWASKQKTEV